MTQTAHNPLPKLKAGDALLYNPHDLFGFIISLKTWHKISHIEVYDADNIVVASRDGQGVDRYFLRTTGLAYVLRPSHFDTQKAAAWFSTVRGQKYDWKGILCFALAVKNGDQDKMFCSEFATRYYRAAGLEPFQKEEDADHIAPFQFLTSARFHPIWKAQ